MNYATALVALPLVCESCGGRISTPEEALGACKDMAYLAQEAFHVLSLSTRNRLINRHMVSLGTVNSAQVGIADCFRAVICDAGAVSALFCHNHCSGEVTPSAEDIAVTKHLIEAGRIVGIRVVDHIIVGRDQNTGEPVQLSLRERGLCQFE